MEELITQALNTDNSLSFYDQIYELVKVQPIDDASQLLRLFDKFSRPNPDISDISHLAELLIYIIENKDINYASFLSTEENVQRLIPFVDDSFIAQLFEILIRNSRKAPQQELITALICKVTNILQTEGSHEQHLRVLYYPLQDLNEAKGIDLLIELLLNFAFHGEIYERKEALQDLTILIEKFKDVGLKFFLHEEFPSLFEVGDLEKVLLNLIYIAFTSTKVYIERVLTENSDFKAYREVAGCYATMPVEVTSRIFQFVMDHTYNNPPDIVIRALSALPRLIFSEQIAIDMVSKGYLNKLMEFINGEENFKLRVAAAEMICHIIRCLDGQQIFSLIQNSFISNYLTAVEPIETDAGHEIIETFSYMDTKLKEASISSLVDTDIGNQVLSIVQIYENLPGDFFVNNYGFSLQDRAGEFFNQILNN